MSSSGIPREPNIYYNRYNREKLVFINCPFDKEYPALFRAIVFAVVCCGLIPVWANAIIDPSMSRIDKIIRLTSDSKYSIHDLCRCHGEGGKNFARLNMPLELGISIGLSSVNNHQTRDGQVNQHKWFALVPSRISEGAYQEFISDLQGSDPMSHGETQQTVVNAIMNIFVVMCDLPTECTPVFVIESLPIYEQELENYKIKWGGGPIPWRNTVKIAIRVAQENELIPHGYA